MPRRSPDPSRQLGPKRPLLRMCPPEALREHRIGLGSLRPSLHPTLSLEPGNDRNQVAAAHPELRRKRGPISPERLLLDHSRRPEWTTHSHPPKSPGHPPQLSFDHEQIIHGSTVVELLGLPAVPPSSDPTDDEELFAGFDETESPRLADKFLAGADGGNPPFQLALLGFEAADLGLAVLEDGAGVLVAADRLPVEDADEHESGDGEQAGRPEHGDDFARQAGGPAR